MGPVVCNEAGKWEEEVLARLARQAELRADVSISLAESGTLPGVLQGCAEAMVRHLDVAFARIWTLRNEEEGVLELQASAGLYTHLDGAHSRVPVGEYKIGRIAQERRPLLTNAVVGDPRVSDKEWAKREGMVAFAGYPLIVEGRLVGVMAMFSRQPLAEDTIEALGSVADTIAQGIGRKRVEEALRESEARYRTLVESIPAITYIEALDVGEEVDHTLLYVSPQVEGILGYRPEEWLANPCLWEELLHPDDRERVLAEDARTEKTGEPFKVEYRIFAKDNSLLWIQDEAVLVGGEDGRSRFWQGVQIDITERKQAENKLQESETNLAEAQRIARLGSWDTGPLKYGVPWAKQEMRWSDELYRILGFTPRQFVPTFESFIESIHPQDRDRVGKAVRDSVSRGESSFSIEHRVMRPDGEERFVQARVEMALDEDGEPVRNFGTLLDITEHKAMERRLEHQAFHDPLTGLPNRTLLMTYLEQALVRAERQGDEVAVLFVDLDDFKVVNDSLGHEAGDRLLVSVGERLQALVRQGDTVARFGGDEFIVLLGDADAEVASRIAQRLLERMRPPFAVDGRELTITSSVGIALGGSGGRRPTDLLRRADIALYAAKARGRNRHEMFETTMEARALERLEKEHVLRRAAEGEQTFVVHYQPIVSLESAKIVGFEALVRWNHPERGLLLPGEFIPLAEQTGAIIGIGHWVLREACSQAEEWNERYPNDPPLMISVNLSASQLTHHELVGDVAQSLKRSGLDPQNLTLEVTENAVMWDVDASITVLRRLKDLGVRIAVDDFGTDYSSLSYLKRLPVDVLKIDRSFVSGLGTDQKDEGIVRAVIDLARTLGLEVIAEGVETGEQLAYLQGSGCDLVQGFYFWGPLPTEETGGLLATYNYP